MKVTKSKGNVFADIGFDPAEAETLAVKSDLLTLIAKAMKQRKLTQEQAAQLCGIDQGTLSKALRGKLSSVTIDRLARWLLALGWNVKISANPKPDGKKIKRGEFSVQSSI